MRAELLVSVVEHPRYFVVLWLHSELDPPKEQWDAAVERLSELRRARRLPVDRVRQLVVSDGGAPNALQRHEFVREFHEGLPTKVAVLTSVLESQPVKRGIATALSWVNPSVRFYEPREAVEALIYLDLLEQRDAILHEYKRLQLKMRPLRDLSVVEFHLRPRPALKAFLQARLTASASLSPPSNVTRNPSVDWTHAGAAKPAPSDGVKRN
jgi:hypothetical protein